MVILLLKEPVSQCLHVAVYIVRGIFHFQHWEQSTLDRIGISSLYRPPTERKPFSCFPSNYRDTVTACTIKIYNMQNTIAKFV